MPRASPIVLRIRQPEWMRPRSAKIGLGLVEIGEGLGHQLRRSSTVSSLPRLQAGLDDSRPAQTRSRGSKREHAAGRPAARGARSARPMAPSRTTSPVSAWVDRDRRAESRRRRAPAVPAPRPAGRRGRPAGGSATLRPAARQPVVAPVPRPPGGWRGHRRRRPGMQRGAEAHGARGRVVVAGALVARARVEDRRDLEPVGRRAHHIPAPARRPGRRWRGSRRSRSSGSCQHVAQHVVDCPRRSRAPRCAPSLRRSRNGSGRPGWAMAAGDGVVELGEESACAEIVRAGEVRRGRRPPRPATPAACSRVGERMAVVAARPRRDRARRAPPRCALRVGERGEALDRRQGPRRPISRGERAPSGVRRAAMAIQSVRRPAPDRRCAAPCPATWLPSGAMSTPAISSGPMNCIAASTWPISMCWPRPVRSRWCSAVSTAAGGVEAADRVHVGRAR